MNFIDNEELEARSRRRQRQQRRDVLWNVLTGLMVLGTVALVGVLVMVFSNPYIALNPYPPPTLPVLVQLTTPTPTETPYMLPATWTPTVQATGTPEPVVTEPTATVPAPTLAPTYSSGMYPFELESDPIAMANTVFHTDGDCNWQGVAGRVVDMNGNPQPNIRVHLRGIYDGKSVDLTTLTGLAAEWYGESGFEFQLGETPLASSSLISVQLEDQSFLPISDQIIISTYADCTKNLILVNFKQVR